MLHTSPTNLPLPAAKQEPYKRAYLLTKNIEESSAKSSEDWASKQKKTITRNKRQDRNSNLRLGRRTREEILKWNQMTALRFQTGGRHQTSPASLRGACFTFGRLGSLTCHSGNTGVERTPNKSQHTKMTSNSLFELRNCKALQCCFRQHHGHVFSTHSRVLRTQKLKT